MTPKQTPKVNKTLQQKKKLLEALEESLGVVTTACEKAKVTRTTFYNYYNDDPEFKKAADSIEDVAIDFAETQLYKQIKDGNPTSTIFYLKTRGKRRGYVEKQEMEHSGDITIKVRYEKKPIKSDTDA
jgi:wyosine [tRNA(Phe)-imidazoG37] synthetase (radical SAM superfamily)